MKALFMFLTNYRWSILITLLLIATCWFAFPPKKTTSNPHHEVMHSTNDARHMPTRINEQPNTRATRRHRETPRSPLANVHAPLSQLYLQEMQLSRLNDDTSSIKNAFHLAWCITSRIDLTKEQQDRLAEFLLQEKFDSVKSLYPAKIEPWATEHLTDEQREKLHAFIAGAKRRAMDHVNLANEELMKAHGIEFSDDDTPEEIQEREEKLNAIIRDTITSTIVNDEPYIEPEEHQKVRQTQEFYLQLAERVPLTRQQQRTIYHTLRKGEAPPLIADHYIAHSPKQLEANIRADTAWLHQALTPAQYETYLLHFLAEIEMIKYQAP